MTRFPIEEVRIRNFKAIRDSGPLKLGGLTVFIGDNGSGKSSVIEALETARTIASQDLDRAMRRFNGLQHIRNSFVAPVIDEETAPERAAPSVSVEWSGHIDGKEWGAGTTFAERDGGNRIVIEREYAIIGRDRVERDEAGVVVPRKRRLGLPKLLPAQSMLGAIVGPHLDGWQFVALQPEAMGHPRAKQLSATSVVLEREGGNIAEYLEEFRRLDAVGFGDFIDALKFVLPYARDLQPVLTAEVEKSVYLQMKEGEFTVPGWLLSSGTLRIAALLALFRHPRAPKVLFVEELENGLDPRTIGLLVEEIRAAVLSGRQQVVLTTHSPYLLDLFPLDSIVVVDRLHDAPSFWRPNDDADIRRWKDKFSPGRLYTTGTFSRRVPS